MHNNFYFLRQLSSQLHVELVGFVIQEVFSQQKDELVVVLSKEGQERFIRAYLSPAFCCLSFPESFKRARKNSVDLLPSICNQRIDEVVQIEQDRSFYFALDNGQLLLFKMHGNRSNVIVLSGDEVVDVFKSSLKQDRHVRLDNLPGEAKTDAASFEQFDANYRSLVPTLGKSFDVYLTKLQFFQADMDERYRIFCELLNYLENPAIYIHQSPEGLPKLCLYRIADDDVEMRDPVSALNRFFKEYITSHSLDREKSRASNSIMSQIKKCESYIYKSTAKLQQLEAALDYRHLGDLIMANLHVIKPYDAKIELLDFYSNEPVSIKLNTSLSPQHNAERYYRKAKKQQLEIGALQNNINNKLKEKQKLEKELMEIKSATDLSFLKKSSETSLPSIDPPYHHAQFMNYEILVGKNAAKNEKLTFQIAKKEDLFLHAKDTSGSHVIVRQKTNQNFPKPVIELAASLAAYYSKSRSESLVRVLYTARKYVRKMKGGPAGTVKVDKERILLVPPKALHEL